MTTGLPSVSQALDQVAAWKDATLRENQGRIATVDGDLEKLRAQIANLQQQLTSLESARADLQELDVEDELAKRSYEAIFGSLRNQATQAMTRAAAQLEAERAHRDAIFAGLKDEPELSALVTEFEQFKQQVEPTLEALPESYRGAIRQHHQGIAEKIRSYLSVRFEQPVQLEANPLELEVVYGIDAPEGTPEVLICVLPIQDVTFTEWSSRPCDLATHIGARVAQAIYETTKRTGPVGAQAIRGGHQGLLAMEVDIEGASADVEKILHDTMAAVFGGAPELAAARVSLAPRKVDFDFLLPPEEAEEVA